jgi:hypothetical protein
LDFHGQLVRESTGLDQVVPVLTVLGFVRRPLVGRRLEFTTPAAGGTIVGFDAALGAPFILTNLRMFRGINPQEATICGTADCRVEVRCPAHRNFSDELPHGFFLILVFF